MTTTYRRSGSRRKKTKEKRPKKIDYVVTWRLGEFQPMEHDLKGNYDIIHSTKNLKLYKYQSESLIKEKDID